MAECNITAVQVLNNPAQFTDPIVLEVQYECISSLQDDLEWRIVYVGSPESEQYDQVLDSALVGPVQPGHFKFRMEAPAPDPSRIPSEHLLGVTALLLTCSYKGQEFVRVGYYVNIEYVDPDIVQLEHLPNPPRIDKLQRNVMADHPRVTKWKHDFDNEPTPAPAAGAEPEPEPDDVLADEEEQEEEDDDEEGEEEDMAEEDLENLDPSCAAAAPLSGKAALVADAGVDDMEL